MRLLFLLILLISLPIQTTKLSIDSTNISPNPKQTQNMNIENIPSINFGDMLDIYYPFSSNNSDAINLQNAFNALFIAINSGDLNKFNIALEKYPNDIVKLITNAKNIFSNNIPLNFPISSNLLHFAITSVNPNFLIFTKLLQLYNGNEIREFDDFNHTPLDKALLSYIDIKNKIENCNLSQQNELLLEEKLFQIKEIIFLLLERNAPTHDDYFPSKTSNNQLNISELKETLIEELEDFLYDKISVSNINPIFKAIKKHNIHDFFQILYDKNNPFNIETYNPITNETPLQTATLFYLKNQKKLNNIKSKLLNNQLKLLPKEEERLKSLMLETLHKKNTYKIMIDALLKLGANPYVQYLGLNENVPAYLEAPELFLSATKSTKATAKKKSRTRKTNIFNEFSNDKYNVEDLIDINSLILPMPKK